MTNSTIRDKNVLQLEHIKTNLLHLTTSLTLLLTICLCAFFPSGCLMDRNHPPEKHRLSESDRAFFDDILDIIGEETGEKTKYAEYLDTNNYNGQAEIFSNILKRIELKEGHVFDSGAVFEAGSSLHLTAIAIMIKDFDHSGNCKKTYDLLKTISPMMNRDYLIVDLVTEKVFDPEINADAYKEEKAENISSLSSTLSSLECNEFCDFKPAAEWNLEDECDPKKAEHFGND